MAIPRTSNTSPIIRFSFLISHLFANLAATTALNKHVATTTLIGRAFYTCAHCYMADRSDKSNKGHNERTCTNGNFQIVAKQTREYSQQQNTAAASRKSAHPTDNQSAKHGKYGLGVWLLLRVKTAAYGLYQKLDTEGNGCQHCNISESVRLCLIEQIPTYNRSAKCRNSDEHTAFHINVFVFSVYVSGQ